MAAFRDQRRTRHYVFLLSCLAMSCLRRLVLCSRPWPCAALDRPGVGDRQRDCRTRKRPVHATRPRCPLRSSRRSSQQFCLVRSQPASWTPPQCSVTLSSSRAATPSASPRLKWASYTSSRFLTGMAAGFVAQGAHRRIRIGPRSTPSCSDGRCARRRVTGHHLRPESQRESVEHEASSRSRATLAPLLLTSLCVVCATRCCAGSGVHRRLSLDNAAVLHSSPGCSASFQHVSAAAALAQLAEDLSLRQHVFCRSPRSNTREERSVHRRSFEGCRDLLARHRTADGTHSEKYRFEPIYAASCTTLARSASPRVSS